MALLATGRRVTTRRQGFVADCKADLLSDLKNINSGESISKSRQSAYLDRRTRMATVAWQDQSTSKYSCSGSSCSSKS